MWYLKIGIGCAIFNLVCIVINNRVFRSQAAYRTKDIMAQVVVFVVLWPILLLCLMPSLCGILKDLWTLGTALINKGKK